MYIEKHLLGLLAVISLGREAVIAHPHPQQPSQQKSAHYVDNVGNIKRGPLIARQQSHSLNTTRFIVPPLTDPPRSSTGISTTLTTSGVSTSASAVTSTIGGGAAVVAVIGATYVAGAGGATLLVGGIAHALSAGTAVAMRGGGPNGDVPEMETVSEPQQTQQDPEPTDPSFEATPSAGSAAGTPTPSFSVSRTSISVSLTSSASLPSSTETSLKYIILLRQDVEDETVQTIKNTLIQEAVPDSVAEVTRDSTGRVIFFTASITNTQADMVLRMAGVAAVAPDERVDEDVAVTESIPASSSPPTSATGGALSPPTDAESNPANVILQYPARDELKAGKGVTIYVIDSGVFVKNPEWKDMPGSKSFMYTTGAEKDGYDRVNHGSCVASRANGPSFGTAKNADVVLVKLANPLTLYSILEAWVKVSNDVYLKNLAGKAVVSAAVGTKMEGCHPSTALAYKLLIQSLLADDIVVVSAAGNGRTKDVLGVNEHPSLLGQDTNVIVVGAVSNGGRPLHFSQGVGNEATVHAPGEVRCANSYDARSQWRTGTSFAVPAVVGVIAVWLSQERYKDRLQVPGRVAGNVKSMLKDLAYPRIEDGPSVVWNGIDPRGPATIIIIIIIVISRELSSSLRRANVCRGTIEHSTVGPSPEAAVELESCWLHEGARLGRHSQRVV
ncbi:alkaline serine protease [Colletotrichum camelliae]|nr:alkaline serine protease [Colletotrichum camelliae]